MTSVSSILCDVIDDVITDDVIRNFRKYFFLILHSKLDHRLIKSLKQLPLEFFISVAFFLGHQVYCVAPDENPLSSMLSCKEKCPVTVPQYFWLSTQIRLEMWSNLKRNE